MGGEQSKDLPRCSEYTEGKAGIYFCDGKCGACRTVWGSGPYTADSCVCLAARHAGVIGKGGGAFEVVVEDGKAEYKGTDTNGVTSQQFYKYPTSITIKKPVAPPAK